MKPLPIHHIPEDFYDIQIYGNDIKFNIFKQSIQLARTNEEQYVNAFKGMLFMTECIESKDLAQFNLKNTKILKHPRLNRVVKIKYDTDNMLNFEKAIKELSIDAIAIEPKIVPDGVQYNTIDGRIQSCDEKFIYMEIVNGFDELSILTTNVMQCFDVNLVVNQTPYQLQLQAIQFLVEHKLFNILINNPIYSTIVEEADDALQTRNQLR